MENLTRCLAAVAGLAQRLPVGPVEEQPPVALVRDDVIDFSGRLDRPQFSTIHTERVATQELQPSNNPSLELVKLTMGLRMIRQLRR